MSVRNNTCIFRPAEGQEPIKFIAPEFVSYLGEEEYRVWETVDISLKQSL